MWLNLKAGHGGGVYGLKLGDRLRVCGDSLQLQKSLKWWEAAAAGIQGRGHGLMREVHGLELGWIAAGKFKHTKISQTNNKQNKNN
jgi:hypothetical protein